jgi:CRP-like cAMP-binding protein
MRNRALASLPDSDFEHLRPHLRLVKLKKGDLIHHQGDETHTTFFPLRGMISTLISLDDGRAVEAAMTGPEGMLDDGALGTGVALGDHVVQGDGEALTCSSEHIFQAMDSSPRVSRMICRAAEISNAYSLRSLVCLNFHQLEARLCRWLLMARFHMGSDDLDLTHEYVAGMLGAQRTTVTTVAKKLQEQGVIAYHRGKLSILDAAALSRGSCECYRHMIARIDATFPKAG